MRASHILVVVGLVAGGSMLATPAEAADISITVTGEVPDHDTDEWAHSRVKLTCATTRSWSNSLPNLTYSATVSAPEGTSTCTVLHEMVAVPSLNYVYLSMERDVEINAGSGSADFGLPPVITVHFVDARGGHASTQGSFGMGTEGTITMPDGHDAWVTSSDRLHVGPGRDRSFPDGAARRNRDEPYESAPSMFRLGHRSDRRHRVHIRPGRLGFWPVTQ